MAVYNAPESSAAFLPSGNTWNEMGREATRAERITVAPPLSMINTPAGVVITINAPYAIWMAAKVTEALTEIGKGRYLAKLINGPVNYAATGDFTAADLGIVDDNQVVEVWTSAELAVDAPVAGWLLSPRDQAKNNRPILFVPSGGADLPKGQYQDMLAMMVTDNVFGFDFLRSHAMETI